MAEILTYGVIAFVVLIIVYYLATVPAEQFEADANKGEVKVPALYDRETGQIISGSEFLGVPNEIATAWGEKYGENDNLDDGAGGIMGLNYAMCSKSCCSAQYPPPFETEKDIVVDELSGVFVPNSYACNNAWQNSGCLCMTKDQRNFLTTRGGNCQ